MIQNLLLNMKKKDIKLDELVPIEEMKITRHEGEKLRFCAVETTETLLCPEKELHIGYEFNAYMLFRGMTPWVVTEINRDCGTATSMLSLVDGPSKKTARFLELQDNDWYYSHTVANLEALERINFI